MNRRSYLPHRQMGRGGQRRRGWGAVGCGGIPKPKTPKMGSKKDDFANTGRLAQGEYKFTSGGKVPGKVPSRGSQRVYPKTGREKRAKMGQNGAKYTLGGYTLRAWVNPQKDLCNISPDNRRIHEFMRDNPYLPAKSSQIRVNPRKRCTKAGGKGEKIDLKIGLTYCIMNMPPRYGLAA